MTDAGRSGHDGGIGKTGPSLSRTRTTVDDTSHGLPPLPADRQGWQRHVGPPSGARGGRPSGAGVPG